MPARETATVKAQRASREQQERLRTEGLRVLARIIARRVLADPPFPQSPRQGCGRTVRYASAPVATQRVSRFAQTPYGGKAALPPCAEGQSGACRMGRQGTGPETQQRLATVPDMGVDDPVVVHNVFPRRVAVCCSTLYGQDLKAGSEIA